MPFVIRGSRGTRRIISAAVGLALIATTPAAADAPELKRAASNPDGCVVDHALTNPFTAWGDLADYALAPGGDFESGTDGWTLAGGAALVAGNQPFPIVSTADGASLELPAGSVATSAPMCIDSTYPFFRMFARETSAGKSGMQVEVLYLDRKGKVRDTSSGEVRASSNGWSPTDALEIGVTFDPSLHDGAAPVQFRFSTDKGSDWQIDDLYVDPYARR